MNSLVGNTKEGKITPLRNPDISINTFDSNIYRLAQSDAKTFGDNPDMWIARGVANELAARDIHLEPQDVRLKVTPDGLKVSI